MRRRTFSKPVRRIGKVGFLILGLASVCSALAQADAAQAKAKIKPPVLLHAADPDWPRSNHEGSHVVEVECVIDERGLPTQVHAVSTDNLLFVDAAVSTVRQYRFKPALQDGHPVPFTIQVAVRWQVHPY